MILRFNEEIVKQGVQTSSFRLPLQSPRREPEPLEDARCSDLHADDVARFMTHLEELVPHKAKNDVLFLLEHGKWRLADELVARVGSMLGRQ
jgi:hypothetical protein